MFIKTLQIKNFRCFKDVSVELNTPDGTNIASGLNIFVGENGTGKTSVLDAIDLLTKIPQYAKQKLKLTDLNQLNDKIEIISKSNEPFDVPRLYGNTSFSSDGVSFNANIRKRDNSTYLQDCLSSDSVFNVSPSNGSNINNTELRVANTKPSGNNRLSSIVSVKYFDKNRSRHLDTGTLFDTQLNSVIDEINFQYLYMITNPANPGGPTTRKFVSDTAKKLSRAFGTINDKVIGRFKTKIEALINISPNLYFIDQTRPFSNTMLGIDGTDTDIKIPLTNIGSGFGMICSFLFLDAIHELDQIDTIYLIDEPELHLHPQLQNIFFGYLLSIAQQKQVIISTHSPFFISLQHPAAIRHFTKDNSIRYINDESKINFIKSKEKNIMPHQRNMVFDNFVIFLEGTEDLERYSLFCKDNGFEKLINHFYIMNGCEQIKLFQTIAEPLGIHFYAIADDDYATNKHAFDRGNFKRILSKIQQFCTDKKIVFDEAKFNRELKKEIRSFSSTPRSGRQTEYFYSNRTRIRKVAGSDILVLKNGELEDYLDNQSAPTSEDAKKELIAIFKYIQKNEKSSIA